MAHVDANVVQQAFRARNDDGSETSATWKAPLNSDIGMSLDVPFRVRFLVEETAGGNANNYSYVLQYSLNGGAWTLATLTTPVHATPSAFVANATPTTQQIGAGAFVAGAFDSNADVSNISMSAQQTEMEYCLLLDSAQMSGGDTVQLRVTNGGTVINGYTNTPAISVAVLGDLAATLSSTTATVSGETFEVVSVDLTSTLESAQVVATGYTPGSLYVDSDYVDIYYTLTDTAPQVPTGDLAATLEGAAANIGMTRFPAYWKKISGVTTILAGETQFYVVLQVDPANNGGWWFDEVVATVNGGANQLTNGTFNDGTKTGWTANPEQDGLVVNPGAAFDPPGAYTLQIDADSADVQQQASNSFAVTEGDVVYVEAWVYFYGGINSNGKANGKAKNASDEVVRTTTVAQTAPDPDVVNGELVGSLADTSVDIPAFHAVVGNIVTTLTDTTAAIQADYYTPVEGDLTAQLDAAVVSAAVDHGAAGDAAAQLAGAVVAITGEHLVSGDLSAQLADTTALFEGAKVVQGDLSAQLEDTTATVTGYTFDVVAGDLAAQLDNTGVSATGVQGYEGTLAAQLAATTAAVIGEHLIAGGLAAALDATTAAFAGGFGDDVSGSLATSLADITATSTGTHGVAGDLAATLEGTQAAVEGVHGVEGFMLAALAGTTATAEGSHGLAGDLNAALGATQASLTGEHFIAGDLAAQLAATTASMEGTAGEDQSGTMAAALAATSATVTGAHGVAGTLTTSLGDLSLDIVASHGVKGTSSATVEGATASFEGTFTDVSVEGDLDASLADSTVAATGTFTAPVIGDIQISLDDFSADVEATHSEQVNGGLSATLDDATAQLVVYIGVSGATEISLESAVALFAAKGPSIGRPSNPGVLNISTSPGIEEFAAIVGVANVSALAGVTDISGVPGVSRLP